MQSMIDLFLYARETRAYMAEGYDVCMPLLKLLEHFACTLMLPATFIMNF